MLELSKGAQKDTKVVRDEKYKLGFAQGRSSFDRKSQKASKGASKGKNWARESLGRL